MNVFFSGELKRCGVGWEMSFLASSFDDLTWQTGCLLEEGVVLFRETGSLHRFREKRIERRVRSFGTRFPERWSLM